MNEKIEPPKNQANIFQRPLLSMKRPEPEKGTALKDLRDDIVKKLVSLRINYERRLESLERSSRSEIEGIPGKFLGAAGTTEFTTPGSIAGYVSNIYKTTEGARLEPTTIDLIGKVAEELFELKQSAARPFPLELRDIEYEYYYKVLRAFGLKPKSGGE